MKIAIVEDEYALAEEMKAVLLKLKQNDICVYGSGEEFLFASDVFDVVFMDIQMKKLNGLETAKELRKRDKNIQIVFLTNDTSFVFAGYEVDAIRYWLKPIEEDKVKELFAIMQKTKAYQLWNVQGELSKIYEDDILYIESDGHYVLCHLTDQKLRMKGNFKDLCVKLSKDFMMTHRSYYVNLNHIHALRKDGCQMDNQEIVPISRAMKQMVQEAFLMVCKKDLLCR